MNFSEHQVIKNQDGTFNILDVPIFELGEHKKFNYDQKWAEQALNNFSGLKKNDFLPRLIVGHTVEGQEKPAVGFLDNLKLKGKEVIADVVNVLPEVFEQIKKKMWPGRSVEVNPHKSKFTALALLGGTEPHFQFSPVQVKYQAEDGGEWIEFKEMDNASVLIEILNFFKSRFNKQEGITKMADIDVKAITEQVKSDLQKQFEAQFKTQYSEKFKEEFGVTPEQFREKLAKERTANYQKVVALFSETMKKKYNLAPAVVDGFMVPLAMQFQDNPAVITFSENQKGSGLEVLEKFGESLAKLAKENQIVVDFSEQTRHSGIDGNPNLKNNTVAIDMKFMDEAAAKELDAKIVKFQADNKLKTYEEALELYLAQN